MPSQGVGGCGERSVTSVGPNGTTASLKGPVWELLLRRIGTPLMTHLLLHCSIFTPLPNGCHLQVCGRPIGDVSISCPLVFKQKTPCCC